ncbi:hypothetical protein A9Z40_03250 [Microbacterium arborescens]|uniref:Tyr recombinase domain-containing protein n=1 Tax=Microbacterium arborescens TaxID=33883 RepID=A0ABX2WIE0_9MICO|nr:site-specific integrase [Microbacterium arborescens]OAZ40972.1 hypothetical protein A9Z40_03250 [Microbacterium arborescens]
MRTRLNYVQMAFRDAVVDRAIPTSPAETAKARRGRRAEVAMQVLSVEQVRNVLEAAGDFRPFVEVCVFAGLRLGEAAGLQLGDVQFLARALNVRRQVQGSTHKTATLVPPKYGSERTIYVPAELTGSLSAHVASGSQRPGGAAVPHVAWPTLAAQQCAEEWRRIGQAAGLSVDITLHTLRHTYASNLAASGCDVVTVQRALGHSQPSITLNVYSHLWPSAEDKTRTATAAFMASAVAASSSQVSARRAT